MTGCGCTRCASCTLAGAGVVVACVSRGAAPAAVDAPGSGAKIYYLQPACTFLLPPQVRHVCPAEDALASSLLSCMCACGGANILSVFPLVGHTAAAETALHAHAMRSHDKLEASAARVRTQVPPGQPAPRVVQRADGRARPLRGRAVRRACAASCGCIRHHLCAPRPCLMRFRVQAL